MLTGVTLKANPDTAKAFSQLSYKVILNKPIME